jgi:hypothetical protein
VKIEKVVRSGELKEDESMKSEKWNLPNVSWSGIN